MTDADVTYMIESRDGPLRMRFPCDPDTTRRLERVRKLTLDTETPISWWRRVLRWLFRIH